MDHLRRSLAPIPDAAWRQIEDEAQRTLRLTMSARHVVDVTGPHGWASDALTTGLVEPVDARLVDGVAVAVRCPIPYVELTADLGLAQSDIDAAERGNPAIDTSPIVDACRRLALAEDVVVFHGSPTSRTAGIVGSSPHPMILIGRDAADLPDRVAVALQRLRDSSVNGPYSLLVGDSLYTAIQASTDHGEPIREHLLEVLDGREVVWSSALDGAVVVSARGGDFELALGQDVSIGYTGMAGGVIRLYLQESVAFRVLTPEAAVPLALRD